jgi:hypothetical protein
VRTIDVVPGECRDFGDVGLTNVLQWIERLGKASALVFIILLVMAAIYLALGNESYANVLAEYAYYSLVASVILMLIVVAKEGREVENKD